VLAPQIFFEFCCWIYVLWSYTVILRPSLTSQSLLPYERIKDVPMLAWVEITRVLGDSESAMVKAGGIETVQLFMEVRTKVTGTLSTVRVTGEAANSKYGMYTEFMVLRSLAGEVESEVVICCYWAVVLSTTDCDFFDKRHF
jgi:hypothetical protein